MKTVFLVSVELKQKVKKKKTITEMSIFKFIVNLKIKSKDCR